MHNQKNSDLLPACACGCGQPVAQPGNRYIKGHRYMSTAVRSRLQSVVSGDDVILTQNLDIVQQMLGKLLKGKDGQNVINIITIGPIKFESNNGQKHNGHESPTAEPTKIETVPAEQKYNGQEVPEIRRNSLLARERENILQALEACDWSQKRAAGKLGISARRVNYAVKRLGITNPNWRKNT